MGTRLQSVSRLLRGHRHATVVVLVFEHIASVIQERIGLWVFHPVPGSSCGAVLVL